MIWDFAYLRPRQGGGELTGQVDWNVPSIFWIFSAIPFAEAEPGNIRWEEELLPKTQPGRWLDKGRTGVSSLNFVNLSNFTVYICTKCENF